ncbi:MAG: hypothetical protein KF752_16230 [Pirellulaceae bacterium]|nr:hypothetical protein [Pirellulaceae bacterium]
MVRQYVPSRLRFCLASALSLLLVANAGANVVYTEDFEHDLIPGAPGFASAIFQHNVAGLNSFFATPFFPTPSAPHALFLGALTTDSIIFTLAPGEKVQTAEVWITGTGGGWAGVTFMGTLGSVNHSTITQDLFQLFSAGPADNIGDIIGVMLGDVPIGSGQEAMYDNLRIRVIPEPSSLAFALVGLSLVSRRYRWRA